MAKRNLNLTWEINLMKHPISIASLCPNLNPRRERKLFDNITPLDKVLFIHGSTHIIHYHPRASTLCRREFGLHPHIIHSRVVSLIHNLAISTPPTAPLLSLWCCARSPAMASLACSLFTVSRYSSPPLHSEIKVSYGILCAFWRILFALRRPVE
jgi:hypothetical protein